MSGKTTRLAIPVSSSMVMKTIPDAVPGRWLFYTSYAADGGMPAAYEVKAWYDPAQPNRVQINTYSWDDGTKAYQPVESGWQVQAYCP